MTTPAFTGLTITISPSPFCDAPGWIARLPYFPHIDGIGKEPEDALQALRESWDRATTIITNNNYHLFIVNNALEHTLQGQYEALEDALRAIGTLTLADNDTWYITHQNRVITQRTPGAHFLGVATNPVADTIDV